MNQDTICAIATAQGGAIGCIRVSGPEAIEITSCIFTPAATNRELGDSKPYTLTFGRIYDGSEVIDEVLVSLFRAPHSYTGENSTEITCHGSAYILQQVMQLLIKNGCRMAQPGEYTQRAFLNGKMDLSQAEAVADVIASQSRAAHRLAMNQMRGGFSHELMALRDKLLTFTSLVELELDFSDHEDLEFADRSQLNTLADTIEQKIAKLVNSFSVGNAIKNGIPVAIVGETNAGKSTLLQVLANEVMPSSGSIRLNGVDWQAIDWQVNGTNQFGYLGQQIDIFDQTLAQNLRLGKPDASDDELWQVLDKVALKDWAANQPEGLNTALGEYGMAVSGGQARRIALARLLLTPKTVLMLDEPFAGLDATNRERLWQHLVERQRDGLLIVVTHQVWQDPNSVESLHLAEPVVVA